jgi:release factor glutamine methyltransferase
VNTIAGRLLEIAQSIRPISATPSLDAQVLLAWVIDKPRSWVLAHPEAYLTNDQEQELEINLTRLKTGEPLPYILGHWEFFGLDFSVTPDVLIPRPETELLVEQALEWLRAHPTARRAVDVGAGSGCIAISLAVHIPNLRLLATDISPAALQIAKANVIHHKLSQRIEFLQGDLLKPLKDEGGQLNVQPATFNLLTANLPYIPTATLQDLDVYRREPTLALDGGPDGLKLVRRLLSQAPGIMEPGGLLLLEIEARQGGEAAALAAAAFPEARISILTDLAGLDRAIRIDLD